MPLLEEYQTRDACEPSRMLVKKSAFTFDCINQRHSNMAQKAEGIKER